MAKLHSFGVQATPSTKDIELIRVAQASKSLIEGIQVIDSLAKPKQFNLSSAYLRRFDVEHNGKRNHSIYCTDDVPIDEITEWQITGTVGDRIINAIVKYIFHTHENNRSGSGEFIINGKPYIKPEYGGITLEDIYQESELYKQYDNTQSLGISRRNRDGNFASDYH